MMTIKPETPVRVLPLNLSTVEQFFCVDSQPRYPMAFVLQLDFTGVIERSSELDEIDLKSLRQRQQRLTDRASIKGYKGIVGRSLRDGYDMFLRRVEPLARPSVKPAAAELCSFPGIASYAFDRDEHERIRQTTGEWGVTVNDLLLAVSFQTMAEWNGARRSWWPAGALRIMMPVDLRETADFAMPATNILGYTFLTRPRRQCTDAVAMVRGIRDETAIMKHERRALRFNDAVAAVLLTPRLMRQVLSMDRCLATVIVSNAGDPTRRFRASFPREGGKLVAGNLVLEDIIGVPPLRIGTRVTLSVLGYQRKLCLAMRCDPHRFALDDTRQVLELYVQNLRRAVQL